MGRERTKSTTSAGAMTRAMMAVDAGSAERVLRIGWIEGSQLREERIFRERGEITVGRHEKSTFVTADAASPSRFAMFVPEGNAYRLHFTDAMDGRLARPEGVITLHALRDAGRARREGNGWSIALDLHARGKVILPGGEAILFQFVPSPPVAPRPQLPVAIRSRPFARTDWTYNACLAAFLFAGFAGVSYVEYGYDPIVEDEIDEVANTVRLVMPPAPEDPPPAAPPDAPAPQTPADAPREAMNARPDESPAHHDTRGDTSHAPAAHRPTAEENAARALAEAERGSNAMFRAMNNNSHFAALVGVRTGAGGVTDVFANGNVMNETLGDLAQAGGVDSDPNHGIHRGSIIAMNNVGSNQLGRGTRVGDGPRIDTGSTTQLVVRAPTGRIHTDGPEDPTGPGDIPIDEVARVVRRSLSALQWCYTSGLRDHPSLQGRVDVGFTIGSSGRITGTPSVRGFDEAPEVQQCLRTRFRGLVFPSPEGGTVDVSFPFQFVPGT